MFGLFKKQESLISVDIGSTAVRLIELDVRGSKPALVNIGKTALTPDIFSGNIISRQEVVAEKLAGLLEANDISDKRAVVCVPGPSVFTKRIKMPRMDLDELRDNIFMEAGNFIPHNIEAIKLDYHIIGESGKNQLDVLVVAVKNEIIESFVNCLSLAGLETAVVDVDSLALQNIFEMSYPERMESTVALINLGARYSSINICRRGEPLFTGDIPVGGRLFTDAIVSELGVSPEKAEEMKKNPAQNGAESELLQDILDRNVDYVAAEVNRQISFFWNASGSEEGIDSIMLTGGASVVPGLVEILAEKTGLKCSLMDPFRGIDCGDGIDKNYLAEIGPGVAVALGMGAREPGDRLIPQGL